MSVGSGGGDAPMCDINTTPLIDVMLVLLVTLILSIPIMTTSVKLNLPIPNPNQQPPPVLPMVIDLDIDFDGTIVWNGTPLNGIDDLENHFKQEVDIQPQPEVHLRPDRRARYEVVAKVMAAAQRNRMQFLSFVDTASFAQD
ncbi:MAG TPA: biopolymer transporter ExbD [Steroidobacteraceae bacterium]|nr:biopolymer transporter ExbD [Steroidobacteraceae bacterium]